jgi:hypothetical protein
MLSFNYSGVVQLVARQPLELVILVRVQAPEPILRYAPSRDGKLVANSPATNSSRMPTVHLAQNGLTL